MMGDGTADIITILDKPGAERRNVSHERSST